MEIPHWVSEVTLAYLGNLLMTVYRGGGSSVIAYRDTLEKIIQ
jgi:hypothetical protein